MNGSLNEFILLPEQMNVSQNETSSVILGIVVIDDELLICFCFLNFLIHFVETLLWQQYILNDRGSEHHWNQIAKLNENSYSFFTMFCEF